MNVRQGLNFIVLLSLLLILNSGCQPSQRPGKWRTYNEIVDLKERLLRKKLKVSIHETESVDQGDSLGTWFLSSRTFYNEAGFDTLAVEFDASGKILKETRNVYQDSLLMQITVKETAGYSTKTDFQYNAKGHKISDLMFKRGDSLMQRDYTVDEYGNEMTVQLVKFRDHTKFRLETKRNAKFEPTIVSEFEGDKMNWSEVYEIQDTLWVIKRSDPAGKLQSDYRMHFNKNGQIISMINKNEEGKIRMHITFKYNEKGQMIDEQYWTSTGQPTQHSTFFYDENGLLKETRFETPNFPTPIVTKHSYQFRN